MPGLDYVSGVAPRGTGLNRGPTHYYSISHDNPRVDVDARVIEDGMNDVIGDINIQSASPCSNTRMAAFNRLVYRQSSENTGKVNSTYYMRVSIDRWHDAWGFI